MISNLLEATEMHGERGRETVGEARDSMLALAAFPLVSHTTEYSGPTRSSSSRGRVPIHCYSCSRRRRSMSVAIWASRDNEACWYRSAASGEACPSRAIASLMVKSPWV